MKATTRIYDISSLHFAHIRLGRRVYIKMGLGKARQGEERQGETHWSLTAQQPKAPKLRSNLTTREWMRWKLSWAAHKRRTKLTDEYVCMDHLWDFYSQEIKSAVIDDLKLDLDRGLDL